MLLTHGEVASPHLNNRTKLEVSAEQPVAHTLPKEVTMKYELTTATQCTQSAQWISKRCLWDCLLENCHSYLQRGQDVVVSQNRSDQWQSFADQKYRPRGSKATKALPASTPRISKHGLFFRKLECAITHWPHRVAGPNPRATCRSSAIAS